MNEQTLLYRQIPPCHVQNGRVTSVAFRPMPKDNHRLSVYDGDRISPEDAFHHFVDRLSGHSEGILAVSGGECTAEDVPYLEDYETHPFHALIDFSRHAGNARRKIAEHLRDDAVRRGWLYLRDKR